nr:hypothetical protein BgiMline_026478 [Biomphalaria glabrata]
MASRRKSARPTNKVQQQVEEDDEDDNGETESALVLTKLCSLTCTLRYTLTSSETVLLDMHTPLHTDIFRNCAP